MDKEENIEHIIEVDDRMKITLLIPKSISVVELQGLMIKSKQLMKVATFSRPTTYNNNKLSRRWPVGFMEEADKVIKTKDNKSWKEKSDALATKYNIKPKRVYDKLMWLRTH